MQRGKNQLDLGRGNDSCGNRWDGNFLCPCRCPHLVNYIPVVFLWVTSMKLWLLYAWKCLQFLIAELSVPVKQLINAVKTSVFHLLWDYYFTSMYVGYVVGLCMYGVCLYYVHKRSYIIYKADISHLWDA